MSSSQNKVVKKDGVWVVDGKPRETFKVLSHHHPSNIPGKSVITLLVTQAPGATTPPHTHNGAAAIGLMIGGASLNQMNCDEPVVYRAGETFYEAPGCHHVRSENVGEEEASFFAVLIIDDEVIEKHGYEGLVVIDAESEEKDKLQGAAGNTA